ncbi:hypothetical protein HK107_07635 [Parvularcula sp. ZS-1/3]|uniref:Uncharacterized protein n=1 Tax=Parvularcula mediterranea TaxID=2732508 RepID=A0A7Y3RLH0_9PROT|nr:hypothetical protein [Parvularcula mediterranea]NNU16189.1 hypothetical protein [Parvularcula mediterranea]
MDGILETVRELSATYNVNPVIFGILYIGGIPLFLGVAGWLAARAKAKKSVTVQALLLLFLAIQPYLYVALFGENLPVWVYGVIAVMVAFGGWSTWRSVEKKKAEALAEAASEDEPRPVTGASAS